MRLLPMFLLAATVLPQTPGSRGLRECASCHPAQAKPQPGTSMAHALELPAECAVLRSHPLLTFKDGAYSYKIERSGEKSVYTVTDGKDTVSLELAWAIGLGSAGQTYVYKQDGQMYQSRISYYSALQGLDFTLGALNAKPANLLQAAGQPMDRSDAAACFGCHSTNAVEQHELHVDRLIPGVQCERCHGPTENHLAGLKKGDASMAKMESLRQMSTEETSNFCGQCHRTWDQIATSGIHGVLNVRFQPYRLTNSKCYDAEDKRIACTACHDPHQEVAAKLTSYDAKCKACHGGGKVSAKTCKVATANCASCHMPQLEIPGSHKMFTDHQIRVVRANEAYPN